MFVLLHPDVTLHFWLLWPIVGHGEATTKLIDSDISGCWLLWWTVRRSAFATAKIIYQPWHCNGQCWNKLRSARIFLRTRYREGSQCNTSQVMQKKKIMAGKWRWPHWKTSEALEGPDKYVRRAKTIWRLHTLPVLYCCENRPVYSYVKLCSQVGIQNWKICYVIRTTPGPHTELSWPDCRSIGRSVWLPPCTVTAPSPSPQTPPRAAANLQPLLNFDGSWCLIWSCAPP
jgi:hypothetical protein